MHDGSVEYRRPVVVNVRHTLNIIYYVYFSCYDDGSDLYTYLKIPKCVDIFKIPKVLFNMKNIKYFLKLKKNYKIVNHI